MVHTPQRQGLLRLASSKHLVADVILLSAGRIGVTDALNLEGGGSGSR